MDVPRKMSSSSLSEAASSGGRGQNLSRLTSPTPLSPNGSEGVKSPKSGTKKFFSIGRRKNQKGSNRKGEASDSEEEYSATAPTMSASSSNDRSQKTLSMILREADEAMKEQDEEGEGDVDGLNGEGSQLGGAFDLELDDDLDEDDGIEVATRR